jgi:hypothetical protein
MGLGEMHTLRELVLEFGTRLTLRIFEVKKQQVWEMYTEDENLAKYVEWRLEQLRTKQKELASCYVRSMTCPETQPGDPEPVLMAPDFEDGLRHLERHFQLHPLKWDLKTGREPEGKTWPKKKP